ncbi:MAG TPA: thermonuclease family protein [Phenylobacterium sp.]
MLAASIGVFAVVFVGGLIWPALNLSGRAGSAPDVRVARVIDGDTIELAAGERVRILNIDTAEMPPRSQCAEERRLAFAAKWRLTEVLRQAEAITLTRRGRDRDIYGRQLRLVQADGVDVGELLVQERLARPWQGHKAAWCHS